jgi:peptidoglycan-N-acetylglucosamine deacetylase
MERMSISEHWHTILGGLALFVGLMAYGLGAEGSTLLGPALVRLERDGDAALTFDDGPSPDTARILDILKEKKVKATFFLCGAAVERYPDIARRIVAEGHELGNHTYSHPYLHLKSRASIAAEIDRAQDAIEAATGVRPAYFRPPHGVRWFSLWPVLEERGMTLALWNSFPTEGASPAGEIVERAMARLVPGAIILLHDGREARPHGQDLRPATVEALPRIIDGARAKGFEFTLLPRPKGPALLAAKR